MSHCAAAFPRLRVTLCLSLTHDSIFSRFQYGFLLPENLRPCKLVGTGSAGVVLCCTDEHGSMVAVKKIRSQTEQGLRRALREVGMPITRSTLDI